MLKEIKLLAGQASLSVYSTTAAASVGNYLTAEKIAEVSDFSSRSEALVADRDALVIESNAVQAEADACQGLAVLYQTDVPTEEAALALQARTNAVNDRATALQVDAQALQDESDALSVIKIALEKGSDHFAAIIKTAGELIAKETPFITGAMVCSSNFDTEIVEKKIMFRDGGRKKVNVERVTAGYGVITSIDLLVQSYAEAVIARNVSTLSYVDKVTLDEAAEKIRDAVSPGHWASALDAMVIIDGGKGSVAILDGTSPLSLSLTTAPIGSDLSLITGAFPFLTGSMLTEDQPMISSFVSPGSSGAQIMGTRGSMLSSCMVGWLAPEAYGSVNQLGMQFIEMLVNINSKYSPDMIHLGSQFVELTDLICEVSGQNPDLVHAMLGILHPEARNITTARISAQVPLLWALCSADEIAVDGSVLSISVNEEIHTYSVAPSLAILGSASIESIQEIVRSITEIAIGADEDQVGMIKILSALTGVKFESPSWILMSLGE